MGFLSVNSVMYPIWYEEVEVLVRNGWVSNSSTSSFVVTPSAQADIGDVCAQLNEKLKAVAELFGVDEYHIPYYTPYYERSGRASAVSTAHEGCSDEYDLLFAFQNMVGSFGLVDSSGVKLDVCTTINRE